MGAPLNFEPQPGVYFTASGYYDNATGKFVQNGAGGGGGGSSGSSATVERAPATVGTTSTLLAVASSTPRVVEVDHSTGTNPVYISLGKAAAVGQGRETFPGGSYETPVATTAAVYGITSAGTESVTVTEFL